ncbi:helix-turn-helix domain-containing protein [Candidatus Viridilinea mediisalina]|uniref:HTH luxR-type domain-containing protein n=1 Tax=Candidatus Viridilinea mediisalina TaxID=2024553 RepID=A0A2A6RP45_9CHLR|nr:helix-turn-helix transcriptional regulator [Candidatus Viridilinea mediisalina]PDW04705.1 hypothetical protein CJ255_02070 [Candidatus Viridilinea mediisalina]
MIHKHTRLTPREHAVMRLIIEGATDNQIAQHLALTPPVVGQIIRRVRLKLGTPNRTATAVQYDRYYMPSQAYLPPSEPIHDQEIRIMHLVIVGCSDHSIAQQLNIAPRTVRYHLCSIRHKLKAENRTVAAVSFDRHIRGIGTIGV